MWKLVLNTLIFSVCIQGIHGKAPKEVCEDCLFLTPLIQNGSIDTAKNLSAVNSNDYHDIRSYSGYITVKKEYNSNLFFWFFPVSEEELKVKPFIIWLQGGPGLSSLKGLFDLIGPFKVENSTVQLRNVTWTGNYSVLFVDNPVGAGFSFTADERGYPDNQHDVGEQLYEFLQQFLQMFPELRQAPLFLAGESYAGKYVPSLGIQIHRHRNTTHPVNLKGLSIGNGLIDPQSMMHYSQLCEVLGLLDDGQVDKVRDLEEAVVRLIDEKAFVDASNKFNETIEYIKKHSGVNIYNFNQDPDSTPAAFEKYVKSSEVRKRIHAGDAAFDLNNQLVYQKMLPDIMNTTKPWVEELLEHYGVMSYSGQLDIILAYSLSKYTFDELSWSRREQYVKAQRKRLRRSANGAVVAYKKSGGNFVDVLIRRAGHMVPFDQPEVAKFIIDNFIQQFK